MYQTLEEEERGEGKITQTEFWRVSWKEGGEYPRIPRRIGNPLSVPLYKASSSTLKSFYKTKQELKIEV